MSTPAAALFLAGNASRRLCAVSILPKSTMVAVDYVLIGTQGTDGVSVLPIFVLSLSQPNCIIAADTFGPLALIDLWFQASVNSFGFLWYTEVVYVTSPEDAVK